MIQTVADLTSALTFLGDVANVDQKSFDICVDDIDPPRWLRIEVTQSNLEKRLRAISQNAPEEAFGNLTNREAAEGLLTIHIEESIYSLGENIGSLVISPEGICRKEL